MPYFRLSNGLRLHYRIHHADGRGYPLVFLHPGLSNLRIWDAQVEAFTRCPCIVLDLLGHGRSSVRGVTDYSVVTMARQVGELLTYLKRRFRLPKFTIIGNSMGGQVAMQMGLDDKIAPLISGLMLVGTQTNLAAGRSPADLEGVDFVGHCRRTPGMAHSAMLAKRPKAVHALLSHPEGPTFWDVSEELHRLARYHVMVVSGYHDEITPLHTMRRLADAIPGSMFVADSTFGHMPELENPTRFNRIVHEYLGHYIDR